MNPESRTGASPSEPLLAHELVADRAAATPDAIAVVEGAREISYAELDVRAGLLARRLHGLGVGPGTVVGVCLPRSIELVSTLLAVWRAGAGYLPLDPEQPAARSSWMLRAAGARFVVTAPDGARVADGSGAEPLPLYAPDGLPEAAEAEAAETEAAAEAAGPSVEAGPLDTAYVIYTSGSTGTPKGVVVSHEGIANRIAWATGTHGLGPADRVLHKTAVTFDAHVWEVFAPLVSGGTLVLAPAGAERDPAALLRAVAEHRVTVLQVVPSVLRLLAEEQGWERCDALRLLFSAGEPLQAELAQRVLRRLGGRGADGSVEIWNTYGPTECAIDVTAHRFEPGRHSGTVPIGRPIGGMRVMVADADGRPVGDGVAGELYAGGVGVARGYLGSPAQTADRFVPDPLARDGSRLYRTGDQVRRREDGVLEYLGRIDHQVKINGVRIEPGEVESALSAHPRVRGSVVTAFTGPDGGKRLAAYVLAPSAEILAGLRGFLQERLPDTHIPAVFLRLDAFPLTVNGKVDRTALPAPESGAAEGRPPGREPRTEAERQVAAAWRELLKTEDVGLDDDFFALGGTSLQLARLAGRLRTLSGRRIQLRGLFAATTVEAQARLLAPAPESLDAVGSADATGTAGSTETAGTPGTTGSTDTAEADEPAIAALPRDGRPLPLSFGQSRLWFLDRMNPQSPEWVAGLFLKVPDGTHVAHVQRALNALVERHEALRTRYAVVDGESVQYIAAPHRVELRHLHADREEFTAILKEEFGRGFDLEKGPLLRAALVRVRGGDHVVTVAMHHITTDGWSSNVLEREFHQLVDAYRDARAEPDLPVRSIDYADYAAWQRARLTDEVIAGELSHWRGVLDGSTPVELPADRPRAAVRDGRGSVVHFSVPEPVVTRLTELGRSHGATPFTTLLTAYATLLAAHTGQWDVPVGTPVAGRERAETEDVVGFFLNSLVLRCGLDERLTFREALERVKRTTRDAFAHQDLPFERLVEELAPERDLSRTPLYQVAFDLHDEAFNGAVEGDEDIRTLQEMWGVAHTDLTLYMRRHDDGTMFASLEFATALYDPATVELLAGRFQRLLAAVAADPELLLGEVDLLPADERERLTSTWAKAPAEPVTTAVHEVFAAQAVRTPDAVAVQEDGRRVTYAELDARANRLAHHLRGLGVGPESRVGVLLDRGAELTATLLAVWKAGGAYVPMDPEWPAERVSTMATDAGAPLVVTSTGYAKRFAGYAGGLVLVDADADGAALAALPATAPGVPADLDRLAYLIYTSGSTGSPKGVAVPHRGLAHHLRWAVDELVARGTGGSAVFSSTAFDLAVPNVWAPLLAGQRVVMLPQDTDLTELGARLLASGPYSFLKLTPGHLDILGGQLTAEQSAGLAGVIVVAGEALPGPLARVWAERLGEARLINEYGPTEASVGTCVHPVPQGELPPVVPIGAPLPGMAMYVLDGAMRPVPTGAVGDLYVGGTGVARGYAGAPVVTAEKFVPDPFGAAGARLYCTGDLARWLPGGQVEFLGRTDHQVKIRGYRVEPGEAQAVLADHPGVREAVVVARTDAAGTVRLAGYFVPAGNPVEGGVLAEYCAELLPDYLVPSSFTVLEAVPLNANGKLDRAALPDPVPMAALSAVDEPSGPLEKRISEVWAELLGTPIGVRDNFFLAGGNSILAIRLIAAIQSEFEIALPVREIFEHPTVAGLANAVEFRIRAEIEQLSDAELLEEQKS
ncbi:amino acid adenylation domain-containing protein [Streptomyces sp. NBC_00090]|uniref:amino acid adenylation domain-containing protein n=1 Tax=Streptomyces sp. NBC_00090 TaxID=2903619 RepID=UPI003251F54E